MLFFFQKSTYRDGGSVTEGSVKKGVVFMCYVLIENVTSGRPTDQALTTVEKTVCYSQFPRGGCTPPWGSVGKYQVNEEGLGDRLWARAFMGAASQEEVSTLEIRKPADFNGSCQVTGPGVFTAGGQWPGV